MPPAVPTRRRFLRAAGLSATTALAGCAFGGGSAEAPSVTPAPVPTDTASPTPEPTPPPLAPADLAFDVAVLSGFTADSPGRLGISVRNTGDRRLTGIGERQHVLPFVDDDYGGLDESGRFGLFLAPDDTSLTIQPAGERGDRVGQFLPDAPTDGCWQLPFDWPAARGPEPAVLYTVSVAPGGTVSHEYGLYHIGDCEPGQFTFESTFDLSNTDPPYAGTVYRTRLGFDLTVTPSETLRVDVHPPRVRGRTATD